MAWYKCSGGGEGIPLITKSGSIVTYEDSVGGVPVNDLVASIVATQSGSGDPSPSNVRPISGFTGVNVKRCGSNIWDEEWELGDIDATTGALIPSNNSIRTKNYISIKPDTQYYAYVTGIGTSTFRTRFYDANYNYIGTTQKSGSPIRYNSVFTTPTNAHYMKFMPQTTYGTTYNHDISINYPATDTTYHAYSATTYSVIWQTEAGTVYGGYIDLTTGVLTVWYKKKTLSELEWVYQSEQNRFYSLSIQDEIVYPATIYVASDSYCDKLKVVARNDLAEKTICVSTGGQVFIMDTDFTTTEALIQNLGNAEFVYPLATPQTYQLTPKEVATILGANHIFADTGDIAVKFYKPVTNLDTLVEQTKDLAPDLLALASAGNGTSTREAFDMTDETTGTKATRIPDYMFYKNLNVEKVNLSTVESVGSNTFYMCPYIKEINLPNATELKSSAFNASSRSLTSPTPMVINLPSCTNIADSALREMGYAGTPCTITLTECETLQGNAIRGASARYFTIDTLNLPSIETIGQECLNYHRITTVDIGPNCTSIASKPFNYGTVETLIIRATTPPTLNANGLGVTPTRIKVPAGSLETYQTASNWSNYASIMEAI